MRWEGRRQSTNIQDMRGSATRRTSSGYSTRPRVRIPSTGRTVRAGGGGIGGIVMLVILFFVTSSDSGSLVVDTITAGGKLEAPVAQRVFWAIFEGLVAVALLVGGGLQALRAAAVSTGLPFTLVVLVMCASLVVGLRSAFREKARRRR